MKKYVFVDSNIFIYAAGNPHPHKNPSIQFLSNAAKGKIPAVINSEVLQEILYYYKKQKNQSLGFQVIEKTMIIIPLILPVNKDDIILAKQLLQKYPQIEVRDAIHAASMLNKGIKTIYSYDTHFDRIKEIRRMAD